MEKMMDKLKVVVLTDTMDSKVKAKNLLAGDEIAVSAYADLDTVGLQKIGGLYPDVVVCVCSKPVDNLFEISQSIYCNVHGCAVVLVSPDVSVDLINRAMRSGIRQVLPENVTSEQLINCIREVSVIEKQRFSDLAQGHGRSCRTLGFFSGKGGTGKTTLAVNTAVALAQKGAKVIIIDCDLQFGDVSLYLDLNPKETIVELVQDQSSLSIDLINGFVQLHSSGVGVICAPKSPEFAEYVNGKQIEAVIDILRPYYEYIILDFPPAFNDVSIAGIESCNFLYLIYNMDIASLKNAKTCMTILESLQQKEKVNIILNKFIDGMIKIKDYETMLEIKVMGTVCQDTKNAVNSLDRGQPLVASLPRAAISKEIKAIVAKIML